ncbi:MAG TPA: TusE/DsrC/DsvC family sulfur relay protein, partial [Spirochaetota bacterium]|nr:TusE/DsrC/DsvC family sulfur relay protein [Spirochaetota bacterium]
MDNYDKSLINRMSKLTNTVLTPRYFEILEFVYEYYQKNKVGPLYNNLIKNIRASKEEINLLFPHGLNSVYTWVGIPIQTTDETCKPPAMIYAPDMREVYFDHNATTYVRDEVAKVLNDYFSGKLGFENPSSSTIQGKRAFELILTARRTISEFLNINTNELFFMSSGSEANNTA